MRPDSAAETYKTARYENAPPLRLVQLMYEGALRFIGQAEEALQREEAGVFEERCLRAHAVVAELRLALDRDQAPELSEKLEALYRFSESELLAAVRTREPASLRGAQRVLTTLQQAWSQLEVERRDR